MNTNLSLAVVEDHPCRRSGSCAEACASCRKTDIEPRAETDPKDSTHAGKANKALLPAPEHVLSTLEKDGSRRWLRPQLSMGQFWKARRIVAYFLMAVFVAVPHIQIGGKPMLLLDIAAKRFTILGFVFLPTDTLLLALFLLSVAVSIMLVTAVTGRFWCGWACPQTVYMEFLFRPIDRLFEGTVGKGGKPKKGLANWRSITRILVYAMLSMFLAHTFLAYFVGVETLSQWIRSSPVEHPIAFVVMAGTTLAMLFDFLFFREQMCTLACPYGRLQSVMLDQDSWIVGFDHKRGEPRQKGKRSLDETNAGDCIDCNKCVTVCPTGIDIRDGLQLECINCTQCIDACNKVMERIGKPKGLIRYASQNALAGKESRLIRARTIGYPILLLLLLTAFGFAMSRRSGFNARVVRGKGAPYSFTEDRKVINGFSIRLVNRTQEPQQYSFSFAEPGLQLEVVDEKQLQLAGGKSALVPIFVRFDSSLTKHDGNQRVQLTISDSDQLRKQLSFRVLGPR